MKDVTLDEAHCPADYTAAERGFVGGLLASGIVLLLHILAGVLAIGLTTGNYNLDLGGQVSLIALVVSVLGLFLYFRYREHVRAEQQYRITETKIERAEALLKELRRELDRE
jgi:hypothetical protein